MLNAGFAQTNRYLIREFLSQLFICVFMNWDESKSDYTLFTNKTICTHNMNMHAMVEAFQWKIFNFVSGSGGMMIKTTVNLWISVVKRIMSNSVEFGLAWRGFVVSFFSFGNEFIRTLEAETFAILWFDMTSWRSVHMRHTYMHGEREWWNRIRALSGHYDMRDKILFW